MPAEIPQPFPTPDRDDLVEKYKRDARFYSNNAQSTDEGSQPHLDANVLADQLVPGYQQIRQSADNIVLGDATGAAAEKWATSRGLPGRIPATGARGYMIIKASAGGTHLFVDDEIKIGNLRYLCTRDAVYQNGALVPVQGFDTGPSTNQPAGTVGRWTAPRPGCGEEATVWEDAEGEGLRGGRSEETDLEIQDRVADINANPPGSGNDAHLQKLVKDAGVALGISVQQCFTYPGILGPGTTGIAFTVLPDKSGGSRIPSPTQIAAIEAWVKQQMPGNDGLFFATVTGSTIDLTLQVQWRQGAISWADVNPWPELYTGSGAIVVQSVTSPTEFVLGRTGGYVGVRQPVVGQTIAFYDPVSQTFKRKRILNYLVFGLGPWTITCDTTNETSDTTYTPVVGQRACPWSESLDLVVPPLLAEFDLFGPGEQVASFFDAGTRQRRQPPPQQSWPSRLGSRVINGVQDQPSVNDAQLIDPAPGSLPLATPVGAAGTLSYLRELRWIAAFPL